MTTPGRGLYECTEAVRGWVAESGIARGLVTVFVRHTSASLLIQENADPDVAGDLGRYMDRLVVDGDPAFVHTMEGPDDMAAHVRSALTQTHLAIPVDAGRPMLGTWQGIYLWEHRARPHRRRLALHLLGDDRPADRSDAGG